MRSKLVAAILIVACAFALMTIPASAAPVQQQGGWTSTYYVLINGTTPQPTVAYSDISGVQVTRRGTGGIYEVTFVRPYRFLVASAYYICQQPNWDCDATTVTITRDMTNPRKWRIKTNINTVMISLIVKP